ncbi:MAG: DNA polymerase III subunit alpha [Mangrovibacterium sp.]
MFLIFDTETTGLPKNWKAPITDTDNWPRMVQLAWQMHDVQGNFIAAKNHVIYPDGYTIPEDVVRVHGITTEKAIEIGIPLKEALADFMADVAKSRFIVGHNVTFDVNIVGCELVRKGMPEELSKHPLVDTMTGSKLFCNLRKNGALKNPTLTELHIRLFGVRFEEAHNAAADVEATSRCFLELIRVGGLYYDTADGDTSELQSTVGVLRFSTQEYEAFLKNNPTTIQAVGIKYESFKENIFEEFSLEEYEKKINRAAAENDEVFSFVHLHVHSQYSILDGLNKTVAIAEKAFADGQPAVALTDHGNMYGAKEFHNACKNARKNVLTKKLTEAKAKTGKKEFTDQEEQELQEQVNAQFPSAFKPIIGVEAYCARRGHLRKDDKTDSSGYHIILLAKNEVGYVNLLKLTSIASTDGFYYKPRIDKELLAQYHEGIIVSSACLGGEISQHIMNGDVDAARLSVQWFKDIFGDDYYLEITRHPNHDPIFRKDTWENQAKVSQVILQLGAELGVKVIATNDSHFTNEEDAEPHDLLVCMNTGKDYDDPTRMRYSRQEWFKSRKEMSELFADIPEVLTNTMEIAEKVEYFELDHDPFMPPFDIPAEFSTFEQYKEKFTEEALIAEFSEKAVERLGGYEKTLQIKLEADYLEHLCFEGSVERYGEELEPAVKERLDFELNTIKTMGFPGYFLIVQDFINWAKNNGVLVGPGRGSAAGSAVAYCVKITDVDPIKYDLLFERFLNPDRISMPDVDIDFDDDGRQRVLDYVTDKYGHDKVAHICTFGTMATKGSIKDVGRVLGLPIPESNRLTKLVGDEKNFKKAYENVPELAEERNSSDPIVYKTLKYAEVLEGTIRQTGVHACGVLIGKNPLNQHLPVMPTKGEELLTTQYDGRFVENIGLLKMDFLGLRTLSIIKETIENIKLSKGVEVDIDHVDLEDEKTYQLFANGETTAIFQFESPGMKKHLKALVPDRFEHLVAMNALYRPGPMEYIPSFIERRHGRQPVTYDHPLSEPYLKDTYGITVYQEQVMLQSRALGGFTRGDSDGLRKAMGKKIISMMNTLSVKFTEGCLSNEDFVKACENGESAMKDPKALIEKIWKDWEAFASYAFNKSHSVCYAYVAYQTGYLKAHYPAEYMAGVMSRNLSDISKITTFMEECQRMGLDVKGPDINESYRKFTVNQQGVIRFGMAGVKGVGDSAVEEIIRERDDNGPFKDVFDFVQRVSLKTVNKKSIESLANAGAFDGFGMKRSQFFACAEGSKDVFLDRLVRFGQQVQSEKANSMMSLFGDALSAAAIKTPDIPQVPEFPNLVLLDREKELIGIYLSAHPLDDYKLEFERFISKEYSLQDLNERIDELDGNEITFGGMVVDAEVRMSKNGNPFGKIVLADYKGIYELMLFGKDYVEYGKYCKPNIFIMTKGKVTERFFSRNVDPDKPKDLAYKVQAIDLLDEVRDKNIKSVTINLSLQSLTPELIKDLLRQIDANLGEKELRLNVWDIETKQYVNLFSRNTRINFTKELERFLREHEQISFKIN